MRKNTRVEDAMLRWPSRGFGADERTGVCSGGASGVCSGVRPAAAVRLLLWARAACLERRARGRERGNGTVREKGVSGGLFIGSDGPQTAWIYCARLITAPGYGAHVRDFCGVTVASCNGHIVGHGVQPLNARSPRESRRRPFGQRTLKC